MPNYITVMVKYEWNLSLAFKSKNTLVSKILRVKKFLNQPL